MPVKIRLQRHGRKKKPFYHIVVADSRAPRDGKFIERIGSYNPMTSPATIDLDRDVAYNWLMKGAQPTDTARAILKFKGVYYKKHLMRGVSKGALTLEEAEAKYQQWIETKEAKIAERREQAEKEKEAWNAKVAGVHLIAEAKAKAAKEKEEAEKAAAEAAAKAEAEKAAAEAAAKAEAEAPAAEEETATEKAEAEASAEAPATPEAATEDAAPAEEEKKESEEEKEKASEEEEK